MRSLTPIFVLGLLLLSACDQGVLNDPYPSQERSQTIFYNSFSERPKTLDPARAYSSGEYRFLGQIYEPPLQYHYLKRPYTLIPLTAAEMPTVRYYDKHEHEVAENALSVEYSVFTIRIKPKRFFQPHPAFTKNVDGSYRYHQLAADYLARHNIQRLEDFPLLATRELTADDYIYQIKRLALPELYSPILGLMTHHIFALKAYAGRLAKAYAQHDKAQFFDLRRYDFAGVHKVDRYTYQIKLKGKYPQFFYWLAMPFFAPIPWEADKFYTQVGRATREMNFDWFPVGTGPYYLAENNPNRRMMLARNPNFARETYPHEGAPGDKARGYLAAAGKSMPFIDKAVYSLEKEAMPRWNKFLQGYYDTSRISSDSFNQAIHLTADGEPELTSTLAERHLQLQTLVSAADYYMGFNMLDPVVGGSSERARLLRQAISITVDYAEYISIFLNGRGVVALGPLPPGISVYTVRSNPYVFRQEHGQLKRRSLAFAKKLLQQAGIVGGRVVKTGKLLVLHLDVAASSGPDDKAYFSWMRKQFAKLDLQLNIRATQYNRFQAKVRHGNVQLFAWGWQADYPDPENFLFLLYGPNGKVKHHGENAANYHNPSYDRLFTQMKNSPNGPRRDKIIQQMVAIVQHDAPWIWGYHPKVFRLVHQWLHLTKPNELASNTLKYVQLDVQTRQQRRQAWNQPRWVMVALLLCLFVLVFLGLAYRYWCHQHLPNRSVPDA
jgi:peptide/nickel transport system substrate-binding protein